MREFSYLALIPRGLQNEISSGLQKQAKALASFDTSNGDGPNGTTNIDPKDSLLKIVTWNETEENETMQEALSDFSKQKKERKERQKSHPMKHTVKHQPNRIQLEKMVSSEWLPPDCSVGSVKLSSFQQHVSIGYFQDTKTEIRDGDEGKECGGAFLPCMTYIGQLTGSAWMQLETDRKEISQSIIAPSRMLGPLLALVSVQTDNRCLEATEANEGGTASPQDLYQRYQQHSLEEMTQEAARHIRSNPDEFSKRLDRALKVWRDCVEATWKDSLSPSEYTGLVTRIQDNKLRFRISCVRIEPATVPSAFSRKRKKKFKTQKELFTYSRQELCMAIMDACGPQLVPGFHDQSLENSATKKIINTEGERKAPTIPADLKSSGQGSVSWSVNLERFDIELVIFITPPDFTSKNGKLAFGISLCPYSFVQSKSFASGNIPPDVTFPYLGGDILSKGIIRLRPTTAHILLRIANLQKYDIVLDPCAGVGTIPVEAEQFYMLFDASHPQARKGGKQFLSIGGDLILNNPKYTEVAGVLENFSLRKTVIENNEGLKSSSLLVAWDAAHLPMRTSSVDVVVSDLPFGQQCLSVTALNQLLPLVFLECARVLTPMTGRMVVLAGGSPISLIALIGKLSGEYWKKPIPRVSPISIGGILAWIVRVDRNEVAFDRRNISKQLDLVRKIAQKRDRINRQRKSDSGEQQTGKRRRKAND